MRPFPAKPRRAAMALAALLGAGAQAQDLCVAGQAVRVQYAGQWYAARVLKGPDPMGTCLVAYDGHGSNWDEWVKPARMRPAVDAPAPAARPAGPPDVPGDAASGGVPPGRYRCYTFDNGLLNYTYTDVVVQAGGRYAVGKDTGSYTLAGGTMHFTGSMRNAIGTFSIKSGGRPQIDLVFDGDRRASMACSRQG